MASLNISDHAVALLSEAFVHYDIMSIGKDLAHNSASLLCAHRIVINFWGVLADLVECCYVMGCELLNRPSCDSKNLKDTLKVIKVASPALVVGKINKAHALMRRANGCQRLNMIICSKHTDGCSSIDACKAVGDEMALF